ncbi:glycoside hydrolase family 2 protein [Streptococcus jiangjianxini]|uniref:glycoside hydrolase family 2 protein n=1 Tax=Streptococcus jiangjianxini TaxID=3161189 RepID=UPI0032EEB719
MKRKEYPRPQFQRDNWTNLNGQWDFEFDDNDLGIREKWFVSENDFFTRTIEVPFVYQSQASGINDRKVHDIVWYRRCFDYVKKDDKRLIVHFGAVDYEAQIFLNGQLVASHLGGNTPFEVDVTDALVEGVSQLLVVRAKDQHDDEEMPRGKQFWEKESRGIWYTNSTGIWQTVWLEEVSENYIDRAYYHIDYDAGKVEIEAYLIGKKLLGKTFQYRVQYGDTLISEGHQKVLSHKVDVDVDVLQNHIFATNFHDDGRSWTPENPNLFDVKLSLFDENDEVLDKVSSYFGFRKIHTQNGMIYLNNKPFYQKLVLDQGYWPSGLLTAPDDRDFVKDIELSKKMGFNGCRKHQKTEDPRFLYWADVLGFVVWGECAAPPLYTRTSVNRLMREWSEIVERDYNHPSLLTWVPINESWGVPNISHDRQEQHFSQAIYHYLRSIDKSRLVISNDGWAATETDIVAIHNYMHGQKGEKAKYDYYKETLSSRENLLGRPSTAWPIFADGFSYQNQPILLTEFGGIAYEVSNQEGWGYTKVNSEAEFLEDYERIMEALYASKGLWGYCYTQITDVEQEINGLLTYDRKAKCDLSKIKEINDRFHVPNVE